MAKRVLLKRIEVEKRGDGSEREEKRLIGRARSNKGTAVRVGREMTRKG